MHKRKHSNHYKVNYPGPLVANLTLSLFFKGKTPFYIFNITVTHNANMLPISFSRLRIPSKSRMSSQLLILKCQEWNHELKVCGAPTDSHMMQTVAAWSFCLGEEYTRELLKALSFVPQEAQFTLLCLQNRVLMLSLEM